MKPILTCLLFFYTLLHITQPAHAQSSAYRQKVERDFQSWLQSSVWPEAKARGISSATFKEALNGVTLDWEIPDLRPPGTSTAAPKVQRQAEFRAPSAYFRQKSLNSLVSIGQTKMQAYADTLATSPKEPEFPKA